MILQRPWIAALLMVVISGCVRSQFNLATQREEYTMTSTHKEVEVGRRIAQRVEEELSLVDEPALQNRVRSLGDRIVAVCDRRELVYHFDVVNDETVNAFSLPGGYVFVNDGLIQRTSTDDELAGVLAHEIAHIAARHAVKRYEGGLGLHLAQLAALATREGMAVRGLNIAMQAARLAYARQDELDADRLAVKYLKTAGLDPRGILTFLEKLQAEDRDHTHYLPRGMVRPHYALTHPNVPERLRDVKEELFVVADYIDYLNTPQ